MATQHTTSIADAQQALLDSAKRQLALVRVAVEKSNQTYFDAAQEYLDAAQSDLGLATDSTRPAVSDVLARSYDRVGQLLALQEKVRRGVAEAWSPVVETARNDAIAWTRQAESQSAEPQRPATTQRSAAPKDKAA